MSNPPNPLAKFHTYSYHHILMIADSVSVIKAFEQREISISSLVSPTFSQEDVAIQPKTLPNKQGRYIVLTNGANEAEYIINKVNWSTIVATNTGQNYGLTNALTEGTMEILEPKGFRFLNAIKLSLDALNSHPSSAVFILKTVFVGHNDDGSVDIINNIKPFGFSMLDIVATFDEAGATYSIEFVGVTNGVSKMPQIANAGGSIPSVTVEKTLKDTIANFQIALAAKYHNYLRDIEKQLDLGKDQISNYFRLVYYEFELDPFYQRDVFRMDQFNETTQQKGGQNNQGNIIAFGPNVTIDEALYKIMNHCSFVQILAKSSSARPQTLFKIHSSIEDRTAETLRIKYKIVPYRVPTTKPAASNKGTLPDGASSDDVLEFDYLYTGRNVDVLTMDLKMQMGLHFYYTLSPSSNMTSAQGIDKFQTPDNGIEIPATTPEIHGTRKQLTPLFFPSSSRDTSTKHMPKPAEKLNFESALRRHAAIESLETKIEIHGNPYLLNDLILTPSELNLDERAGGRTPFRNWHKRPALIKVNVKMPNTNDDNFSSTPFWYDGYFTPIEVINTFENGEFRQTIDMISILTEESPPDSQELEEGDNKQTTRWKPIQTPSDSAPSVPPPIKTIRQQVREEIERNLGVKFRTEE